jgi:IS5 family transposase
MIDLRHPLAVLANRMHWKELEATQAHLFARLVRAGKKIENSDLLREIKVIAGSGFSNAGRSRLNKSLMVSLLYLNHTFTKAANITIWASRTPRKKGPLNQYESFNICNNPECQH